MYTWHVFGIVLRRFNSTPSGTRLATFYGDCNAQGKFGSYRKKISIWFKEQSVQVAHACTRQFEFIAAQRIRRGIQIFHLYTKIWDEVALKEFMKSWRCRIAKNTNHFLMSAVGVTLYNWDRDRISDEEINSYNREIEGIYKLRDSTVVCAKCHLRIIIDNAQPGIKYCQCHGVKVTATANQDPEGWQPFMEKQDMLIWRRQEPDKGGLFAYKVYGSFPDVSADDFLQVQIDVDYRKEWDPTARELHVIETDPRTETSASDSTDIIYWEMIWPTLFANRDYVYQRRWVVDKDKGVVVIVSKVTDHPSVPAKPGTYRVSTYWSYMVIRPYTEFHEPGIEFGLTYFDDPGVNVPSAVTAWVAMKGLPEFLIQMRQASKDYQKYKTMKQAASVPQKHTISNEENITDSEISKKCEDGDTRKNMLEKKEKEICERQHESPGLSRTIEEKNNINESEAKEERKEEQGIYLSMHGENDNLILQPSNIRHYTIFQNMHG